MFMIGNLLILLALFQQAPLSDLEKEALEVEESSAVRTVHFESEPAGAMVMVDRQWICRSTPCTTMLREGKTRILMVYKWYRTHEEEVDIKEGATIKFVLEKKPHQVDAVILVSKLFDMYFKAVVGIKNKFKGTLRVVTMGDAEDEFEEKVALLRRIKPKVIITVGLRATKMTYYFIKDTPVVFCMAIQPRKDALKVEISTGVDVSPDPVDAMRAIRTNIPALKKIGLVYDPERTGNRAAEIHSAALDADIEIVDRPVFDSSEVPGAFEEVLEQAQAIWLLRDITVSKPELVRKLIDQQVEKKVIIIGWSRGFVKDRAFCSYASNYKLQGEKAAEIANSIISGADPKDIPIQQPEGVLIINLDTAIKMHYLPPLVRKILPWPWFRFTSM